MRFRVAGKNSKKEWRLHFAFLPVKVANDLVVWLEFYEFRSLPGSKGERRLPGSSGESYEFYIGDD